MREAPTAELLDGRYQLIERIGEGGMAQVWRAEDTALERTVAIKLMRDPADTLSTDERARSEVTLLASLDHHALVTVFDAHIDPGGPTYLVMEHVTGPTLRDRIAAGPMGPQDVAAIAADLAEGLHVVHAAGIVHRDIKPSNVLLSPSPLPGREFRAKLADFGIAYMLDSTRVTTPGVLMGTAAYLAPEQVRGENATPAADVYALGLVLLEAVTARRAFAGTMPHELLAARLSADPDIPEALDPPWRDVLTAMTAREPRDRPSAMDVAAAVATLVHRTEPATDRAAALESTVAALPPALTAPMRPLPPLPPLRADEAAEKTARLADLEEIPSQAGATTVAARSRRRVAAGLAGGVAALGAAIIAVAAWTSTATPEPAPTVPVVEHPAEEPAVPDDANVTDGGVDTGADGSGSSGESTDVNENSGRSSDNGNDNPNSGPGNNSGSSGSGNSGNGNSGNGNSGNGNNGGGNGG